MKLRVYNKEKDIVNCPVCGNSMYLLYYFNREHVSYIKCKSCGFIKQYPEMSFEQITKKYNVSDSYFIDKNKKIDYVNGEEYLRKTSRLYISLLKKTMRNYDCSKLNILDVGCGTGILISEFQKDGHNVLGIELSEWAAKFGRKKYKVNIIQGDLLKINLPQNHFDIITMMHVIEHFVNPLYYLKKITTLLKDDGVIVIATPSTDSFGARIFGKDWRYYIPNEHISLFNHKSLCLAMKKRGLKVIKKYNILYTKVNKLTFLKELVFLLIKKGILMVPLPIRFFTRKVYQWKINRSFCSSKDGIILMAKRVKY